MPQSNEWFFVLIFFIGVLGLVVTAILFFFNSNHSLSPRLLAIFLLFYSVTILHNGLTFTDFYLSYPHLWRSTSWTTFCIPWIAYLYVRSVLYQSFKLKSRDWLFFIPSLLYTFLLLPYYLLPKSEKLLVITRFMADKTQIAKEPEVLLPQGWGVYARLIFGLSIIFAQYFILVKKENKIIGTKKDLKQNRAIIRWLFLFTTVLSSSYLVLVVEHFFHFNRTNDLTVLIVSTMGVTVLFISLYLLARPSILYGIQGWQQEIVPVTETIAIESQAEILSEKKTFLTIQQGDAIKAAIESHFLQNHSFLKSGYKIKDLSDELEIPTYQLSACINQGYGKNFSELVNDFRVDYLKSLLISSPEYYQFTLEALSSLAGFKTRNSFIAAVKRKTGMTPSEFFGSKSKPISPKSVTDYGI